MAAIDFKTKIADYDTIAKLRNFWKRVESGRSPAFWPAGLAYEYLILQAFVLCGADVTWPYEVPLYDRPKEPALEQIDGLVWLDGVCYLVEAKDLGHNVNFDPIAKLRSRLLRRPSPMVGVVFSSKGFTEAAKVMARFLSPQTILLWEGAELTKALESSNGICDALRKKYRVAMKYAMPDFNIVTGQVDA